MKSVVRLWTIVNALNALTVEHMEIPSVLSTKDLVVNKLQRFVIVGKARDSIDVIGTNSGQAFVEAAANKHRDILSRTYRRSFRVVEITKLRDFKDEQHD